MYYYLGPYQLNTDLEGRFWDSPEKNGSLNLCTKAHESDSKKDHIGLGLFWCVNPLTSPNYLLLGNGHLKEIKPGQNIRKDWEKILGYKPEGDTVADWIFDQLTFGGDPNRDLANGILVPTITKDLELVVNNEVLVSNKFQWGHRYSNRLRDLLRLQLKDYKQQAVSQQAINPVTREIDNEWHRRCAKAMCEKYNVDWEELKPLDWGSEETPLEHNTVISDAFTNSDGTALSSHNAGFSWGIEAASMQINSNQVNWNGSLSVYARAESDLSSSDTYSQIVTTGFTQGSNHQSGPCSRYTSASSACYFGRTIIGFNPDAFYLSRTVDANDPGFNVATNANCPIVVNDVLKITSNGSTQTIYLNGVSKASGTDTNIATGTRCGIFMYGSTAVKLDTFEAGDIAAAVVNKPKVRSIFKSILR